MGHFGIGIPEVLLFIPYLAFVLFGVFMVWRFVKAFESIAKSFEKFVDTKQNL
jgi:hypothetical protein